MYYLTKSGLKGRFYGLVKNYTYLILVVYRELKNFQFSFVVYAPSYLETIFKTVFGQWEI